MYLSNSNLVNINTASLNELMTLSGVGESKAKNIISYRENTPFKTIEDIIPAPAIPNFIAHIIIEVIIPCGLLPVNLSTSSIVSEQIVNAVAPANVDPIPLIKVNI